MRDKYRCVDCGVETTPDTGHRGAKPEYYMVRDHVWSVPECPSGPQTITATFCASDV
jgi:hypothetical protein